MVQFTKPLGSGNDDKPEHGERFPMSHAETVKVLRNMGAIPPFIPDEAVTVQAYKPSTGESVLIEPGYEGNDDRDQYEAVTAAFGMPPVPGGQRREWHLDDVFPHTRFDDPPGGATPEEYFRFLMSLLERSADLGEFTQWLSAGLGTDLVISHDVHPDLAMQVCEDFAARLYRDFREHA